jgi:hypothetical protein
MSVQLEGSIEVSERIDRPRRQELCQHIRRLIQDHSLELANGGNYSRETLDEALRKVWLLEQSARQT